MHSLASRAGVPPRGFSLEVSGRPGSGRRLFVWGLLEEFAGEGVLYFDLVGRFTRYLYSAGGEAEGVSVVYTLSPEEMVSLMRGGEYGLVVLDSVPRLFFDTETGYKARWGAVAQVLYAGLRVALRGGRFVAVNYRSRRSFGETVFSPYFTHRVATEFKEGTLRVAKLYPVGGEIVLDYTWRRRSEL